MTRYNPQRHHRPTASPRGRRSIRLAGYDYTQPGAYFVTMVTRGRELLFGDVVDGEVKLSPLGKLVYEEWFRSAKMRREIELHDDEFIIMPNHLHGIVHIIAVPVGAGAIRPDGIRPGAIRPDGIRPGGIRPGGIRPDGIRPNDPGVRRRGARRAPLRLQLQLQRAPRSLSSFVAGFKSAVTSRAWRELGITGIWQRNYYERIIRDDLERERVSAYIRHNPAQWAKDRDTPAMTG